MAAVVETRGLTKHYGDVVGIDGVDLLVEAGEVFGFLGPNGAGKTTTIRLILDLIRPTAGEARLFGLPVRDVAVRERVGYTPGELELDPRMTGAATLEFLGGLAGRGATAPRRGEICERLGLAARDLDRPVRDYSRGMKQKLGLVTAFQHDPDLLILDEPTTGLDPLVREAFFELLLECGPRGKTVFHSSHVLSEVDRTCTNVAIVRAGRLIAVDRVDALRRRSARRLVVRFAGAVPDDAFAIDGVEVVEHNGAEWSLRIHGDLNPVLAALARYEVDTLVLPEPTLDEAFVNYYRDAPGPAT